jgi:hypothetical protein
VLGAVIAAGLIDVDAGGDAELGDVMVTVVGALVAAVLVLRLVRPTRTPSTNTAATPSTRPTRRPAATGERLRGPDTGPDVVDPSPSTM